MSKKNLTVTDDVKNIDAASYDEVINDYIDSVSDLSSVRSVYQMGSISDPGISDIDLIVVADPNIALADVVHLSAYANGYSRQSKDILNYVFLHDIFLYDTISFKNIHYAGFNDNLRLLSGEDQKPDVLTAEENAVLSLQIIFDFVSSRLSQFQQYLASGNLSRRGTLVRVSSIRHSYQLLENLGIQDEPVHTFVNRVTQMRADPEWASDTDIITIFLQSFYYFSRIVTLASEYFFNHHLNFYSAPYPNSIMKINPAFILKFVAKPNDLYVNVTNESVIYYPEQVLYHYMNYLKHDGFLGKHAAKILCYEGDEVWDIEEIYHTVLGKRLEALESQLTFLTKLNTPYAMGGYPGFLFDRETMH